jgi:hypothetical protein
MGQKMESDEVRDHQHEHVTVRQGALDGVPYPIQDRAARPVRPFAWWACHASQLSSGDRLLVCSHRIEPHSATVDQIISFEGSVSTFRAASGLDHTLCRKLEVAGTALVIAVNIPPRICRGLGGHPGTATSTGITVETRPHVA